MPGVALDGEGDAIIAPAMPSPSQDECLMVLRTKVRGQENLFAYEARTHNVRGFEGRIYPLVRATDIAGLYAMAHRSRVAVIALGSAKVLLDISERPSNGGCMSFERFVRYECSFCLVTRPEEVDSARKRSIGRVPRVIIAAMAPVSVILRGIKTHPWSSKKSA